MLIHDIYLANFAEYATASLKNLTVVFQQLEDMWFQRGFLHNYVENRLTYVDMETSCQLSASSYYLGIRAPNST